jgi:2-dehydro-3-deoxygluconokinase
VKLKDDAVTTPSANIICVGESMVQFVPRTNDPTATEYLSFVAGAESNVAFALANLGSSVAWVSRVGADHFGGRILGEMAKAGIDVSRVSVDDRRPTGVMFKRPAGTSRDVLYLRSGSAASEISTDTIRGIWDLEPRIVYLTGITPALSPTADAAIEHVMKEAKARSAAVWFDVNFRPHLWASKESAARRLGTLCAGSDVVLAGLDEAKELWGVETPGELREMFPQPRELVVKDAPRKVTAFLGSRQLEMTVPEVTVLESVGAGDAFAAGYLHGRLSEWSVVKSLFAGHVLAERVLRSTSDVSPMLERDLLAHLARGAYRR